MIDTFSMASAMTTSLRLDTAPRLRDTGDPRGDLGWPLREQLIERFDGHTRGLAKDAHRRALALAHVLRAHEPDHLPMVRGELVDTLAPGEVGHHVLAPLFGVDEEPFVVELDIGRADRRGRHVTPPCRLPGAPCPRPASSPSRRGCLARVTGCASRSTRT